MKIKLILCMTRGVLFESINYKITFIIKFSYQNKPKQKQNRTINRTKYTLICYYNSTNLY